MAEWDNTELLSDIRARGGLPPADLRFTDAKLLAAATIELRDVVTALLVETQTERQVYVADMTVAPGTAAYRLPSRAVAGRWQSVGWIGQGDSAYTRLRQVHPEAYYLQSTETRGTPYGFFVRDYKLVLLPTPNAVGTIRVPYYMRPNALVAPAECAVVLSVDLNTNTITVEPGTMPPAFGGVALDVVRGTPGFETLVQSIAAGQSGDDLIFVSGEGLPDVVAGDYVCLAGQSPVPQCPVEVRGLLATRAARRALFSVNEGQQASMLDAQVDELTDVARNLLSPRVDAEPQEWGDPARGLFFGVLRGIGR